MTKAEQIEAMDMINAVTSLLEEEHEPDGYNIGMNCGISAGQTIPHAHIHVIPQYQGDVLNPRGGVRGVIPEKQDY